MTIFTIILFFCSHLRHLISLLETPLEFPEKAWMGYRALHHYVSIYLAKAQIILIYYFNYFQNLPEIDICE